MALKPKQIKVRNDANNHQMDKYPPSSNTLCPHDLMAMNHSNSNSPRSQNIQTKSLYHSPVSPKAPSFQQHYRNSMTSMTSTIVSNNVLKAAISNDGKHNQKISVPHEHTECRSFPQFSPSTKHLPPKLLLTQSSLRTTSISESVSSSDSMSTDHNLSDSESESETLNELQGSTKQVDTCKCHNSVIPFSNLDESFKSNWSKHFVKNLHLAKDVYYIQPHEVPPFELWKIVLFGHWILCISLKFEKKLFKNGTD